MNIKAPFRYMGRDLLRSIGVYYALMVVCTVALNLFLRMLVYDGTMNDIEMGSGILLFVVGLNTFTEYFGMLLQNGVSRKTFFVSRLLVFACMAGLVVVGDTVFSMVLRSMSAYSGVYSRFYMLYSFAGVFPGPSLVVWNLLFNFMMSFLLLNVGACIVTMFYRLPSPFKAIVGAGVPVLLLIGFPFVDGRFFGGALMRSVESGIDFAFGLSAGRPYMGVITLALLAAVFGFLGWLLTRRATFRK